MPIASESTCFSGTKADCGPPFVPSPMSPASVGPSPLMTINTQVWLFDKSISRRTAWSEYCRTHSIALRCFDAFDTQHNELLPECRILVLDESVLQGDIMAQVREVKAVCPRDLIALTLSNCSSSQATKLIHIGASWVFDIVNDSEAFREDCHRLLRLARERHQKLQTYLELRSSFEQLSEVEKNVLQLILAASPNKRIAKQLNVSVRTIESRRAQIYRKYAVDTIVALVQKFEKYLVLREDFSPNDMSPCYSLSPALEQRGEQKIDAAKHG